MQIKNFLIGCLLLISFISQAQTGSPLTGSPLTGSPSTGSPSTGSPSTGSPSTGSPSTEPARVSFTIKNPTLKNKLIGFNSYDAKQQKLTAGYGYGLNALGTHAVNLPSPVYIYEEKNGKKELFCVVMQQDGGKTFSMNQDYEISREQYLDFARAEMAQRNIEKNKDDNSIEGIAAKKGIKVVSVNIKGSSWLPSMAHVRYELPWGNDNQLGFSGSLSRFNGRDLILPVGTKVYQCSDKFWSKSTKFTEKHILTIDDQKSTVSVTLN